MSGARRQGDGARWGVCDFAFGKVIWVEFSLA